MDRIFLAYALEDIDFAERLKAALEARGAEVRTNNDTSRVTANMDAGILSQVEQCPIFVILLSPTTHNSRWVVQAANMAYLLWQQHNVAILAPVRLTAVSGDDYLGIEYLRSLFTVDGVGVTPDVVADRIGALIAAPGQNASPATSAPIETERARGFGPGADHIRGVPPMPEKTPDTGGSAPATTSAPPAPAQPTPSPHLDEVGGAAKSPSPAFPSPPVLGYAPAAPPMQAYAPAPEERARGGGIAEGAFDVMATAYHPKEVVPRQWESLLIYLALDTPQALAAVAADATERLRGKAEQFRPVSAEGASRLKRGARLTIVPVVPGFEFNPPTITASWQEDVQRHEFRMRATTAAPGQAVNGAVTIFNGGLIFADIPVSLYVRQAAGRADLPGGFASQIVRAYRKVFASYSHKDADIVKMCKTAAETTGDRYLMDVTLLRAGQQWSDELLRAIGEADIFQLFWSQAAALSPHVTNEWRYALQLLPARPTFIRPVFWSREPYAIPTELTALHFERLDLAKMGFARAQPFWRGWLSRA